MKPLRTTMRALIGLHRGYIEDLIERLEKGAKADAWIEDWRRECDAVRPMIDQIIREREQVRRKAARS